MAHEAKTRSAPLDEGSYLAGIDSPERRAEAERLIALFKDSTGYVPRLWGPSIVGFGRYAYRYDSGHAGESLATGFSPRKAELSIYIPTGGDFNAILARLGPHRMAKACLYIKRLELVDEGALRDLIRAGLDDLGRRWPIHPL
jgi:Domain of unknown function (DU1801)